MLIPLGILAGSGGAAGAFDHLLTTTVTGSPVASVTIDVSPFSEYKHLQLRLVTRDTRAAGIAVLHAQFNGDTASNYVAHRLFGNGSTVITSDVSGVQFFLGYSASNNAAAGIYSGTVMDILDAYSNTKAKTIRSLNGYGGGAEFGFFSGAWRNTNPISSIRIYPQSDNFALNSRFSLYGVKG